MKDVFDRDEVRDVLRDTFYKPTDPPAAGRRPGRKKKAKKKPDHYQVICISMYREDLERVDRTVAELKEAGHRKMSRSALIRFALDTMDTSELPKSY